MIWKCWKGLRKLVFKDKCFALVPLWYTQSRWPPHGTIAWHAQVDQCNSSAGDFFPLTYWRSSVSVWLVVSIIFYFSKYWEWSSQLTNSYFWEGLKHHPGVILWPWPGGCSRRTPPGPGCVYGAVVEAMSPWGGESSMGTAMWFQPLSISLKYSLSTSINYDWRWWTITSYKKASPFGKLT